MAKKATDFLKKLDDRHPHMTLDIDFEGEEVPLVFRNFLRLDDEEQREVHEALEFLIVISFSEGDDEAATRRLSEILTEEEKGQNLTRVYVERLVSALRSAASDKEVFEEFISGIREQLGGDFKQYVVAVFEGYSEETRLGEAERSASS